LIEEEKGTLITYIVGTTLKSRLLQKWVADFSAEGRALRQQKPLHAEGKLGGKVVGSS